MVFSKMSGGSSGLGVWLLGVFQIRVSLERHWGWCKTTASAFKSSHPAKMLEHQAFSRWSVAVPTLVPPWIGSCATASRMLLRISDRQQNCTSRMKGGGGHRRKETTFLVDGLVHSPVMTVMTCTGQASIPQKTTKPGSPIYILWSPSASAAPQGIEQAYLGSLQVGCHRSGCSFQMQV